MGSNSSSKSRGEKEERERLKRMDELTKQLQEINKASEVKKDASAAEESNKDQLEQNTFKKSVLDQDHTNGSVVHDQLAQIRINMSEKYSKSVAKAKSLNNKKKKKKKKKASHKNNSSCSSSKSSMTKGALDKDLGEDELLEQLIRENEIVKPRTRPNFLNNNKNEALQSFASKKLENRLKEKSVNRKTKNAKKIREDMAKKRAATTKKKKKR